MKKILIVDDHKMTGELCQRILSTYNFVCEVAQGGKEALEMLDDSFALVITDFHMPDFDGIWLSKQIKDKFKGKIPVILMTGSIYDVNITEAKKSGVSDFLLKPFNIAHFLQTVLKKV